MMFRMMPDPDYQEKRSYFHRLPKNDGNVYLRYIGTIGTTQIRVFYKGDLLAETPKLVRKTGEPQPRGFVTFPWSTDVEGDGIVRVEVEGNREGAFYYKLGCPGDDYADQLFACRGVFDGSATGDHLVEERIHDMGTEAGVIEMRGITYDYSSNEDVMLEVIHGGNTIYKTDGYVSMYYRQPIEFDYDPDSAGGDTEVRFRIHHKLPTGAFTYYLFCVDATGKTGTGSPGNGRPNHPKWCGDEHGVTESGGAGRTDTYYDLGDEPGNVRVRYQTYNIPDTITVYQNENLVAYTKGPVAEESSIEFSYDPAAGREVVVRVEGSGETSWSFLVECPTTSVECGKPWSGEEDRSVFSDFGGAAGNNEYALVEYATAAAGVAPPNGAPNRIQVKGDGLLIDDTVVPTLRWEEGGYGGFPVPATGLDQLEVSSPGSTSYWRQTVHCPIEHLSSGMRFERFTQGLSKMTAFGPPGAGGVGDGAYQISIEADKIVAGNRAFMVVNMFHTTSGNIEIAGVADDLASVFIVPEGGPINHVATLQLPDVVTESLSVEPGTYFIYVLVENIPDNTPSWLNMKITDTGTGRVVLITSDDWRGAYFEPDNALGAGNAVRMPQAQGLVFDNDADANNYMSNHPAPSVKGIFNTWPRTDGPNYYATAGDASGEGDDWYFDDSIGSFVMPTNTASPNSILSPNELESYGLNAVLTSSDNDDDTIGLVVGAKVVDGIPHLLVVGRSQGGQVPRSGFGLIYYDGVNAPVVIQDWGEGDTSGSWEGKSSRVSVRRSGDSLIVDCERFGGGSFQTNNFNFNDDSRTAKFAGSSRYGYYTHSQASSTFKGIIQPMADGRVYSVETNKIWEAQNGNWVYLGDTEWFSKYLEWPRRITNPETDTRYLVYRRVVRKG
tara:strand:+ start:51216 stop:53894 length:2679 start_codon:yes stop_codon:yes gene_type:complete